jgi:hypothetical protein
LYVLQRSAVQCYRVAMPGSLLQYSRVCTAEYAQQHSAL